MIKKYFDKIGPIKVYLVDETEIRNSSIENEEFSNFAINSDFNIIPKNEIWISHDVSEDELIYFITNAMTRILKEYNGLSYDEAYEYANKKEKHMRELVNNELKYFDEINHRNNLYIELISFIKENNDYLYIYKVDGKVVRDLFKTDFVEGGHGLVYKFIPESEIWIDNEIESDEIPLIIDHEINERNFMKEKNFSYLKAHYKASKIEWKLRKSFY